MLARYVVVVGAIAVAVAFASRKLSNLPASEALLALAAGAALGPHGTGILQFPLEEPQPLLTDVSRLLLAFTLMTIAMRYPLARLRENVRPVAIMILVVLPLMAVVPTAAAVWLTGVPFATAAVLGAALAPTDPVLASDVVSGVPAREALPGRMRQILSYESGFNDGLALILVLGALALTEVHDAGYFGWHAVGGVAAGIAIGLGAGLAAGALSRRIRGSEVEYQSESTFPLFTLTFGLFVLGIGDVLDIDAILGVFVAGLAYNALIPERDREPQSRIEEGTDRVLLLPVFVLFGVALPWELWLEMGWTYLAFAVLVVGLRRLPFVLALCHQLRLDVPRALWLGWFGPIGVAALFYLSHAHEQGLVDERIWAAGTLTIAVSTVLHGVTATLGRRLFVAAAGDGDSRPHPPADR